jgi:hypothetical protein
LDERASSHHSNVRDRRPTVNQGRFDGVEKRRNKFNSELNTFRSKIFRFELLMFDLLLTVFLTKGDRPIEEIRPMKRDMSISRGLISNGQSMRQPLERSTRHLRINKKPHIGPIAMDREETSRYSSTPVNKIHFKLKSSICCIFDYIIGNETKYRRKCNNQSC